MLLRAFISEAVLFTIAFLIVGAPGPRTGNQREEASPMPRMEMQFPLIVPRDGVTIIFRRPQHNGPPPHLTIGCGAPCMRPPLPPGISSVREILPDP